MYLKQIVIRSAQIRHTPLTSYSITIHKGRVRSIFKPTGKNYEQCPSSTPSQNVKHSLS